MPPNLGQFDVHWSDGSNDLFAVEMSNEYVDIQIYTDGLYLATLAGENDPYWTVFQPGDWAPIASSREQLTVSLAGMVSTAPTMKGTAAVQHVDVTNENAKGAIYYWTPTLTTILRYDVANPNVPPAPLYGTHSELNGHCIGCHTLSHDGTKIAMTVDGGYGEGAVLDVATGTQLIAWDGQNGTTPQSWNFATFTPDATKLVTVLNGQMQLLDTNGGSALALLDNSAGLDGTHPEFSPDGTLLVNTEHSADMADYYAYNDQIVMRTFDNTTNTFGEPQVLVAYDAVNAPSTFSYYPSFSPDGKWIAFSQSTDGGYAYNNESAETWVVKADGSAPPIELTAADSVLNNPSFGGPTNSWARWVPYQQTFGSNSEPLYYLTFSTMRPFGVRLGGNTRAADLDDAVLPRQGRGRHGSDGARVPRAVPEHPDRQSHRAVDELARRSAVAATHRDCERARSHHALRRGLDTIPAMRMTFAARCALILATGLTAIAACGDDGHHGNGGDGGTPDAAVATLAVSPPTLSVTITNGSAVVEPYTARNPLPDGTNVDVPAATTFSLSDPTYGAFTGPSLNVTGGGAGIVNVLATASSSGYTANGTAQLIVNVKIVRLEGSATSGTPGQFGSATEDPTIAPGIVYPADGILVPPNLGEFDVHWANGSGAGTPPDLFELRMANDYVDIQLYTDGLALGSAAGNVQPFWSVFEPVEWAPIASSKEQLTLSVVGMLSSNPATKGTAATQHINVTNENTRGGIYYWSTSLTTILRYDVSQPGTPPAQMFANDPSLDGVCIGCHTLSHDGSKIAFEVHSAESGTSTVLNVADLSELVPWDGGSDGTIPAVGWNFATFTPDATKLVAVNAGVMNLLDVMNNGAVLTAIPNQPGLSEDDPDLSPDGTMLASVEQPGSEDIDAYNTQIVTRTFNNATNTFGDPTVLVPYDAVNAPSTYSYYPSYSPDGQWIAFTQTTMGVNYDSDEDHTDSYENGYTSTWVVKADGTMPPIRLALADTLYNDPTYPTPTNSWARWVPFGQTFGSNSEPLFYLTFSSGRQFGVRAPSGANPQIWMTPFFPDKAIAGMDPSGPAFRLPFQDLSSENHIAQWTDTVVVISDQVPTDRAPVAKAPPPRAAPRGTGPSTCPVVQPSRPGSTR